MNIVFVASEVSPFAKTGGLADVAGSLPKALGNLGHTVTVFMPRYRNLNVENQPIQSVMKRVRIKHGAYYKEFNIYQSTLPDTSIPIYFIDKSLYFDRENLYGDSEYEYDDNPIRFHFFCLAVLSSLQVLDIPVDVIHCNDWQTAMIPILLENGLGKEPFYQNIKTLYTIHNLLYQGNYDSNYMHTLGLDHRLFSMDGLEFWGKVSFAKGGIMYSDIISTVSVRYSEEIKKPEFGCGLDGVLSKRTEDLYGVVNGIDTAYWSSQNKEGICAVYSIKDMAGKTLNKDYLLKSCGFKGQPKTPVIAVISRLVKHKGFDILFEACKTLCQQSIRLVFLVKGDSQLERRLQELENQYPTHIKAFITYDFKLAKQIYAGSDLFLMPSQFEPCGLGQLISMQYGTVPIVRAVGGLADTVNESNGFVFEDYSSKALIQCVNRALVCFQNTTEWQKLQINGMNHSFSWKKSAQQYTNLYRYAKEKRKI